MTNTITISLPWPGKQLHSHNRGHWRTKAPAIQGARYHAAIIARQQVTGDPWPAAIVHYHFRFPDRLRRDFANLIQSMKPSIDGIVDAGLIVDDSWHCLRIGSVTGELARGRAGVDLTFEAAKVSDELCGIPHKIPNERVTKLNLRSDTTYGTGTRE